MGFQLFFSFNPEHPGANLEWQWMNGQYGDTHFYHVTVEPTRYIDQEVKVAVPGGGEIYNRHQQIPDPNSPINRITIHCDSGENHSFRHLWYDCFQTGLFMCLTCPLDPSWVEPPGWWSWFDASTGGPRGFDSPIRHGGDPATAEPHGGRNGEPHTPQKTTPTPQRNCTWPGFDQLSAAQQGILNRVPGTGGAAFYNSLSDPLKASFLNLTGDLARMGLNFSGLSLQQDGIHQDRLLFAPGGGISDFQSSIQAGITSGAFDNAKPGNRDHPGMSDFGARQGVTRWSLQVGIGQRGAFADVDPWGPVDVAGGIGHSIDYLKHKITGGKTDPFAVGRGLGSSVTGYTCRQNRKRGNAIMTNKKALIGLLIFTALPMVLLWGYQPASLAGNSMMLEAREKKSLKLVAEYKKNSLEDISADGRLLLFYQTGTPIRTYTFPLDGGRGKAHQPPVYDDLLRVVERESGRELRRVRVQFFPEDVQFIPGTEQVFYKEPHNKGHKLEWRFKMWNLSTGDAVTCSEENVAHFAYTTFVNGQYALGALWQENNGGELLIARTLPGCKQSVIGPIDPTDSANKVWGGLNLSPSKSFFAYGTGKELIIRDTANLSSARRINPPSGLIFGGGPIYTADGKYLLIVTSNTILDKPETKRYLLFYDATNYKLARQLDITSWSPPDVRDDVAVNSNVIGTAMAVSPDSRLLAVGYTKEEKKGFSITEQAYIVLYDLATGEEVARASHPVVRQQRNDPFVAKIGKLAFTPDGKYLLSSTHDTLVWEIISKVR